jgi:hypothetical protein
MPDGATRLDPEIATGGPRRREPIDAGTSVEVRTRFDGRWSAGFEVVELIGADSAQVRYRLRRTSDGAILPVLFADNDITSSRL